MRFWLLYTSSTETSFAFFIPSFPHRQPRDALHVKVSHMPLAGQRPRIDQHQAGAAPFVFILTAEAGRQINDARDCTVRMHMRTVEMPSPVDTDPRSVNVNLAKKNICAGKEAKSSA